MIFYRRLIPSLFFLCMAQLSFAEQLNVAVASNFTAPMRQISAEFEKTSGHTLNLSFGSSGKFFAQISHGAPFQIFLSADQTKPSALDKAGFVVAGSQMTYAVGTLALWSPNPNLIDAQGNILRTGKFNKLAIASPILAPYGVAAMDVLRHLNLEESIRNSLVTGENIAQTYQFVSTGNADMGFVALSQIMKDGLISSGSAWRVPTNLYRAIKQDAVLLKKAEDNAAAKEFMAFLSGVKAQKIILSYGYQILE